MSAARSVRVGTIALHALLAAAILAAFAAFALHWASRSDTVLRWAVAQVAQRLPGTLTVTGMRGALVRPVHIDHVEYVRDDSRFTARDVDLEWSPSLLALGRRLWIRSLTAAAVEVTLAPSDKAAALPAGLAPPMPISVDRLVVGTLRFARGTTTLELSGIDLAYAGDARFHTLRLARLDTPWGTLDGQLELLAQRPFTLSGDVQFRSSAWPDWPVSVRADLAGSLSAFGARGSVQLRELPPIGASIALNPFDPVPLGAATARIEGLDLAHLLPGSPQTVLTISLEAHATPAGALSGQVQASNAMSGPLDQARLPVRAMSAAFDATRDTITLRDAALELGEAARAYGAATLRRDSVQARLAVTALDLNLLHSVLRRTALDGSVSVTRTAAGEQVALDLAQARMRVQARVSHGADLLEVHDLTARIADGTVQASGQMRLSGTRAFSAQASAAALDPAALVDLPLSLGDLPAAMADVPAARVTGRAQVHGQLAPQWRAELAYALERSRWRGQTLSGTGRVTLSPARVHDVDAGLALAGNRVALRGALGQTGDRLQFQVRAPALSALGRGFAGALEADGALIGSLQRPALEATLEAHGLALPGGHRAQTVSARGRVEPGDDPRIAVRAQAADALIGGIALTSAQVQVDGTRAAHRIAARATRAALEVNATLEGGLTPALERWSGRVLTLDTTGAEPLRLLAPAPLAVSREAVTFGPAEIGGDNGRLRVGETAYSGGRLSTSGSIQALRVARVLTLMDLKVPLETDLVLGGRWSLAAERQVDGRIELYRESGDVTALIDDQRLALGVDRLAADIKVVADHVAATLYATGTRMGLAGRLETRLEQRDGRWGLPGTAPLSLAARAQVESIKPIAALLTRAAVVDGSVSVDITARGSVAEPGLSGEARGNALSVEQVGAGVYLTDGTFNAQFERQRIRLQELTITGGEGRFTLRGEYEPQRQALALDWTAERLTLVQRPDLLIVASGKGAVSAAAQRSQLRGALRIDRGRVELRESNARELGDDVVVVGRKPQGALPQRGLKSQVDLGLELGEDFHVRGRGLDARLAGRVQLTSPGNAPLRAQGEINVASGTYEIYGRKLDIDPGALRFAGPVDNPALEIRAMRKNQAVEAGVEITGTARNPQVRLVSVPDVPEMEKLSWLTLGRKLETASQSDTEAMQQYGAALATTIGTGTFQSRVARAVGLDEITVLPGTDPTTEGGIVQVGKRLGDRIYVLLEQRLSTAENILKVNYQLTRSWSLRLESGETDAVDVFYTISFD